jgi:hypothetical protein
MTQESLGMHIALRCRASSTTTKSYSHFTRLVGKWHTRPTKEKRFVTVGQVPGSEEVSALIEALELQLELEDIAKHLAASPEDLLPPPRICCLPREPAASQRDWLPSTHTCYVPPPPRFRNLLEEVPPGYSAVGCFTIPNSLVTSSPYVSKSTRSRTGVKIYGGRVYICYTPGNRAVQRTFYAKSREWVKVTFGKRFQVYRFKGSDRILYGGDRQFYRMRWELIALHVII